MMAAETREAPFSFFFLLLLLPLPLLFSLLLFSRRVHDNALSASRDRLAQAHESEEEVDPRAKSRVGKRFFQSLPPPTTPAPPVQLPPSPQACSAPRGLRRRRAWAERSGASSSLASPGRPRGFGSLQCCCLAKDEKTATTRVWSLLSFFLLSILLSERTK